MILKETVTITHQFFYKNHLIFYEDIFKIRILLILSGKCIFVYIIIFIQKRESGE